MGSLGLERVSLEPGAQTRVVSELAEPYRISNEVTSATPHCHRPCPCNVPGNQIVSFHPKFLSSTVAPRRQAGDLMRVTHGGDLTMLRILNSLRIFVGTLDFFELLCQLY